MNRDLLTRYTARIKVKHIDPVHNSSVLYEDIANTLDGGVNATDDQMGAVLFGCGANGGSMGVVVNATHPTYNSSYFAYQHAVTSGIIVKVMFGYSPDARVKP
ncbi:hypothetical protein Sste5346_002134 [Sporothrix stenoceras]|uniref:Uncharacterized protein n=1 Tax=Sporothrix stenoceras TaxID=5173 RepID=A0ABR3ZLM5_9PEZI